MEGQKPKSLRNIEEKMASLEEGSLRYHVLESAKNFKSSWIELGRSLYSVYKDKLYKEWGFSTFDAYTLKEIGIKKPTAMKLLRSYYFLEKEEPAYLKKDYAESVDTAKLPSYEAIDLLRKAKDKKTIDEEDYSKLRQNVFEDGKDTQQIKKDLTALIREREELEPEEAHKRKRVATIRRFLGSLKGLKQEAEISKLLPFALIKETQELIKKIEAELE
jgi:regulator of replication initiation timing